MHRGRRRPEKDDDILGFSADDARNLMTGENTQLDLDEIKKIILSIKVKAAESKIYQGNSIPIHYPLKFSTIKHLEKNGFEVEQLNSLAIQKDILYYIIQW